MPNPAGSTVFKSAGLIVKTLPLEVRYFKNPVRRESLGTMRNALTAEQAYWIESLEGKTCYLLRSYNIPKRCICCVQGGRCRCYLNCLACGADLQCKILLGADIDQEFEISS